MPETQTKKLLPLIGTETAVKSLMSFICPNCGKRKGTRKSLCGGCYARLPGPMKKALYSRVMNGYEEALTEAMNFLGADQFMEAEPFPF
jgi:hypothetical protein